MRAGQSRGAPPWISAQPGEASPHLTSEEDVHGKSFVGLDDATKDLTGGDDDVGRKESEDPIQVASKPVRLVGE